MVYILGLNSDSSFDGVDTVYQEPPDRVKERAYVQSGASSIVDKWLTGGFLCGFFIVESGVVADHIRACRWPRSLGGGMRNATLMRDLTATLNPRDPYGITLSVSNEFGIPSAFKETVKFATLAFETKRGLANSILAAGSATKYAVPGKLTLAPWRAKHAEADVGRKQVLGIEE